MSESRLTLLQRQQLRKSLKSERVLPLQLSATEGQSSRNKLSGVGHDGRTRVAGGRGLRSIKSIIESGAYDRPRVQSGQSVEEVGFGAEEKVRLQNLMAFGRPTSPGAIDALSERNDEDDRDEVEIRRSKEWDETDHIIAEIQERQSFMEQMRQLGLDKKYGAIVDGEISQRIRELRIIQGREKESGPPITPTP